MGALSRFEQRLGGIVEGAFAKMFKGGVEPVELASALTRECDQRRAISATRSLVPNQFAISLSGSDYERLAPYGKALGEELGSIVREHAEHQRYTFVGPVVVTLERDEELAVGVYHVTSAVNGGAAADPLPPDAEGARGAQPTNEPVRSGHDGARLVFTTGGMARAGSTAAAGQDEEFPLADRRVVLGRGADCDIRLSDTGVSRQHGEIRLDNRAHIYRDLGSTNGSVLNGRPVHEARLEDGDRLELGRSSLLYRKDGPGSSDRIRSSGRESGEGSRSSGEA